jgi:hypothetical protein
MGVYVASLSTYTDRDIRAEPLRRAGTQSRISALAPRKALHLRA